MTLLFRHKKTYTVDRPFAEVEKRLRQIVTRRWEDYSTDLVGRLDDEGSFRLRSKWPLVNVQWIDNNPGRITGKLSQATDGTQINIVTTPNQVLVTLFYIFFTLLCIEAVNIENFIPVAKNLKIAFLAGINVILIPVIILLRNGVKRRFEELMELS